MTDVSEHARNDRRPSLAGRVWTFIRIMNVRLRFIFLMVIVGLVVGYWENITNYYDRWTRPQTSGATGQAEPDVEYFCPMHPNIIRSEPDKCPICGMPLSERSKSERESLPAGVLARVQLTPLKVYMGRIATSPVGYELLSREIRSVGIVDYDETRRAIIAARIKGRIDRLFVDYVGRTVARGDPLVWIYSPDLLIAQDELLSAARSLEQAKQAGGIALASAQSLVEASRRKLLLWGITSEQVDEIIRRGKADTHLTIYSPIAGIVTQKDVLEGRYVEEGDNLFTIADLSRVWMEVKIFEDQIAGIEVGSAVEVTNEAYPDRVFAGRITFIAYTVDPVTRTVSARVEIDNQDYALKPGMYARAMIRLPVGQVTETPATRPAGTGPAGARVVTEPLVQAYLAVSESLAKDRAEPALLARLAHAARELAETAPADLKQKGADLVKAIDAMTGKGIKEQREAFKRVSADTIALVKAHPAVGLTVYLTHCPMAAADWLQRDKPVRNPYYGKEMLECGEVKATIQPGMAAVQDRYASGYFCPVRPDRLFERPEQCPIDSFPMKYVRIEKVLAVPESAVIDTGTRQVVYRESAPGVFDMMEVRLGPRAGGFYPVLSGLNAGDRIATAGAFLVDAESRLNPAAAGTYFGASGGP